MNKPFDVRRTEDGRYWIWVGSSWFKITTSNPEKQLHIDEDSILVCNLNNVFDSVEEDKFKEQKAVMSRNLDGTYSMEIK